MRLKQNGGQGRGKDPQTHAADKVTDQGSRQAPQNQQSGGIVVALPFEQAAAPAEGEAEPVDGRLIDRQIQAAIGRQLRMMYNDVASEPVPDKFLKLLDQLASKPDDKP